MAPLARQIEHKLALATADIVAVDGILHATARPDIEQFITQPPGRLTAIPGSI